MMHFRNSPFLRGEGSGGPERIGSSAVCKEKMEIARLPSNGWRMKLS
jgi:hypothetical protein